MQRRCTAKRAMQKDQASWTRENARQDSIRREVWTAARWIATMTLLELGIGSGSDGVGHEHASRSKWMVSREI